MKTDSFTKLIPVCEEEYKKFRETQNQQAKLTTDELTRPVALNHLVQVQDEKTHALLASTDKPADVMEKRLIELSHTISILTRLVENQVLSHQQPRNLPTPQEIPLKFNYDKITSIRGRDKAQKVLDSLGPSVWNDAGELVVDGKPIPHSNREDLMNYAVTDWSTKYAVHPPVGASSLHKFLLEKAIHPTLLNSNVLHSAKREVRGSPSAGPSSALVGHARGSRKRSATTVPFTTQRYINQRHK